jgi:CheY-like chemotaxis protein
VIANLLNNAARYTDSGGTVSIGSRAEGGRALIEVRDTGAGIEPDMLGRIFDMFVQEDGTGHRAKGGLGIGLALARRLVELHGGEIRALSKGRGHGSTFELRLPLVDAAPSRTGTGVAEKPRPSLAHRRVLVVDDNVDAAESLAMLLTSMGHEVRVVHNGPAAIEAAQAERPDIVLLDIGMPGMDGREVVKRLRGKPELRDVRIAAVSGFGQESDILRSKEAGFDEHLVKPVPPEVFSDFLSK